MQIMNDFVAAAQGTETQVVLIIQIETQLVKM